MEKDHMMEKREPHDTINLFKEVQEKILFLRNQEVILDADVAQLYGVETREVNQAVRNNPNKFPKGYVFEIDRQELTELRSKFLIANKSKSRTMPKAFTEKGLYMLATILKSPQATQTTIAIIETFAIVRHLKRELRNLHEEHDKQQQQSKMQYFGDLLSSIVMPDLETSETESSLEINFLIGKIKHTVKRVRRQNDPDYTETE